MTPPLMDFCKAILEGEDAPDGLVMGGMASQTQQRKIEEAYKKAGYRIPKNGLRHSFGSYRYAVTDNADKTSKEMGNSPTTLKKSYYRLATPNRGAEWFALTPSASSDKVIKAA